jgi:predicted transcriptional regulator
VVHPFSSILSIEESLVKNTYLVVKNEDDFIGILTVDDILLSGHQLVIDCLSPKRTISAEEEIDKVLLIMREEHQQVLPVVGDEGGYLGSITRLDILEALGLFKRQPPQVEINNIVGSYDSESIKQSFIHDLYHNTKNPLQVIFSSISLMREVTSDHDRENLLESISVCAQQIDDTLTGLFFSYFKPN